MKILGWTEESECCCCGRVDLKRTLAVQSDDGERLTLGSDCARRHLGMADMKAVGAAVRGEYARLTALAEAVRVAESKAPASVQAAALTEECRAARIPFAQRPARIGELRAEGRAYAAAQFTAEDLADLERFRQRPSAYA